MPPEFRADISILWGGPEKDREEPERERENEMERDPTKRADHHGTMSILPIGTVEEAFLAAQREGDVPSL